MEAERKERAELARKAVLEDKHPFELTFAEVTVLLRAVDEYGQKLLEKGMNIAADVATNKIPKSEAGTVRQTLLFMRDQLEVCGDVHDRLDQTAKSLQKEMLQNPAIRDEFTENKPELDAVVSKLNNALSNQPAVPLAPSRPVTGDESLEILKKMFD